jgi:hypothetical protein
LEEDFATVYPILGPRVGCPTTYCGASNASVVVFHIPGGRGLDLRDREKLPNPVLIYALGATAGSSSSAESTVGQANRGTHRNNADRPLVRARDAAVGRVSPDLAVFATIEGAKAKLDLAGPLGVCLGDSPMGSPFPGMDPYLEQYWRDVHHRLITYACDRLQPRLPADLRARVEERVFVESEATEYRIFFPDVHVVEQPTRPQAAPASNSDVALEEPLVIQLSDEPLSQGYIEIIDAGSGNRVITVIELLSPSNKVPGKGQDLYLQKQWEVRVAGVSLVEIDLTRTGRRVMTLPPHRIPPSHRTTYQVCVQRGWVPRKVEVYRAPLERRLPAIRVPLRETDQDVPLDLQALIDLCYENGRYEGLNYQAEPVPPLDARDAAWTEELLRSKGVR